MCGTSINGIVRDNALMLYEDDMANDRADIPGVLPLTSSVDLLIRNALYIRTYPDSRPLAHLLFIQETKDFFSGTFLRSYHSIFS